MEPQGSGVQAGSGLVSKTIPLPGARGYTSCVLGLGMAYESLMVVFGPRSLQREEKSGVTLSSEDPLIPL